MAIQQAGRLLHIHSAWGDDALILTQVEGSEQLSAPFKLQCNVLALSSIDLDQLLGQAFCVEIIQHKMAKYFHGVFIEIEQIPSPLPAYQRFQAMLVPQWQLLNFNCQFRIFQHLNVVQICQQIFTEHRLADYEWQLKKTYPLLDDCTQYNESDLTFLQRILSQAGIFYYFKQTAKEATLVFIDSPLQLPGVKAPVLLTTQAQIPHWHEMTLQASLHTTRITRADYLPLDAARVAFGSAAVDASSRYQLPVLEDYQFPAQQLRGSANHPDDLSRRCAQTLAYHQWQAHLSEAEGNRLDLHPGDQIQVDSPMDACMAGHYWLYEITHKACDISQLNLIQRSTREWESGSETGANANPSEPAQHYLQQVQFVPAAFPFAPLPMDKPRWVGSQPAIVVGPAGQTLYCDAYGRVKVQFFWDRFHEFNEHSSGWLRVAQPMSGDQFGHLWLPRIGQEVSVAFLNGDVDQPVVAESFFHAQQSLPFSLPEQRSQMGFKTQTIAKSGDAPKSAEAGHVLCFDDQPGAENFLIQSEKDTDLIVKHDFHQTTLGDHVNISKTEQFWQVLNGQAKLSAGESLSLLVGSNGITLDASGVKVHGPLTLKAKGIDAEQGIARLGDQHHCPKHSGTIPHIGGPILGASGNVLINRIGVARQGDPMQCHVETDHIKEGVESIQVNGKPLARLNHASLHGGVIHTSAANAKVAPYEPPENPLSSEAYPSIEFEIKGQVCELPATEFSVIRSNQKSDYLLAGKITLNAKFKVEKQHAVDRLTFNKKGFEAEVKNEAIQANASFNTKNPDSILNLLQPSINLYNQYGNYTISLTPITYTEAIKIFKGALAKNNTFSDQRNDFEAVLNFKIEVILTKLNHDRKQAAETDLAYDLAYFGDDIKSSLIKIERDLRFALVLESLIVYRLIKFQYQTSKMLARQLINKLNASWQSNSENSDDSTEAPAVSSPECLIP